jgi:uncharacterized protein
MTMHTTAAHSARQRPAPILLVLLAIVCAWALTRWWLYPALDIPEYAPMILRPVLGFAVAWWLITRAGEHWRDYGLRRPASWWRLLVQCALLYAAMALSSRFVVPLLAQTFGATASPSMLSTIGGDEAALLAWLAIAWGVGGFIEELLFRGFLLNRIEAFLGGAGTPAIVASTVAICAQAALFGALHLYQGSFGFVFAGLFALIYGVAYRLFDRNLWPLILVHGTWNSIAIWGAYSA